MSTENREIKKETVENLFDAAAVTHGNLNSVLDAGTDEPARHSNIYRDYFTKRYLLKNISPKRNEEILDFGCGVGRITSILASRAKKITGIDLSAKMLEIATRQCNFSNVEFIHLESFSIPFPNNSFDKIFTHWVLQHASDEDVLTYLREFKRILRRGGKIFLFEQVKNKEQYSEGETHVYRSKETYLQLLNKAGFASINNFPVMKVPSRGMSLWNKKLFYSKTWKSILAMIDNYTMLRKPQFSNYYTMAFISS